MNSGDPVKLTGAVQPFSLLSLDSRTVIRLWWIRFFACRRPRSFAHTADGSRSSNGSGNGVKWSCYGQLSARNGGDNLP